MSNTDHRSAERRSVRLHGNCRTGSGLRDTVAISDISEQGCCISTNGMLLNSGSRLVIRPEGLEGMTGEVRWIDGLKAGLRFDQPLYGPVVDHFAKQWQAPK